MILGLKGWNKINDFPSLVDFHLMGLTMDLGRTI